MKRPLLLLSAVAGALFAPPGTAAIDAPAFIALAASVLRIEVPRDDGGFALGSAVAVGGDTVVTNCHVTRDASQIRVVRGDVRRLADAQASRLDRDLCLVRVPGLAAPAATLGSAADLTVGQAVTAIGYTGGIGIQRSPGQVLELHRFEGARVIQSSNWFGSGASGGGLFDDQSRLVGVLTFRLRGGSKHYFAAPAEWVRELVADARNGGFAPISPLVGAAPYWQSAAPPPFLKAAQLRQEERWSELATLGAEWSGAEPDDAEPWFVLGDALQHLGRAGEARPAFECALRLEPGRAAARQALAELPPADARAAHHCGSERS